MEETIGKITEMLYSIDKKLDSMDKRLNKLEEESYKTVTKDDYKNLLDAITLRFDNVDSVLKNVNEKIVELNEITIQNCVDITRLRFKAVK